MGNKSLSLNTISGQAYEIIKNDICDGVYPPGYWLQEKELAKQLSISRSPIREAFHRLATEQLVKEIPNKGTFVRDLSPRDIEEIFELRVLLENHSIDHITPEKLTEEVIDELKNIVEALKSTYIANDLKTYIGLDKQLHNMIIHIARNATIESVYNQTTSLISRFRSYSLTGEKRFHDSVTEHEKIVKNILSGNTQKAKDINYEHLSLARDQILEYIEKLPSMESR